MNRKTQKIGAFWGALMLLGLTALLHAEGAVRVEHVEVELIPQQQWVTPGQRLLVGLRMKHDPHWHTYWKNPGDSGMPTSLDWTLPAGFSAGAIQWPTPKKLVLGGLVSYAYEGEIVLPVWIDVPQQVAGESVQLRTAVSWLMCKEGCIPGDAELTLTLAVKDEVAPPVAKWADLFAAAGQLQPQDPSPSVARRGAGWELTLDGITAATGAYFIPDRPQVIDDAADQSFTLSGGTLRVQVTPSPLLRQPVADVKSLAGVLVVEDGRRPQAWRVDTVVAQAGAPAPAASEAPPAPVTTGLLTAIVYALLGGMLLNLMPCVFPVLSIKILGFVQQAGADRRKVLHHGLAFGAGVVLSFWALVGLLMVLRLTGQQLGWGFQLQHPGFVAVMALLLFAVGLNLAGVFEIGTGLMTAAGKVSVAAEGRGGLWSSGLSGVLATAIATPCTAPLMGPAVGAALALPPAATFIIFTALGIGMALPYMLLSAFPQWLAVLPRPGAWMVSFKQFMAFPMFAAAIWLVWVYGQQVAGVLGMLLMLVGLLTLAMACWVLGRWGEPRRSAATRWVAGVVAALLLAISIGVPLTAASQLAAPTAVSDVAMVQAGLAWQTYSDEALAELKRQGRTVFVDFTADWCLTCKFNEHTVLATQPVLEVVKQRGVAMLKADWTRRDEKITAALARYGRNSVPLYVVYGPAQQGPVLLPTIITPGMVVQAIEQASAPRSAAAWEP